MGRYSGVYLYTDLDGTLLDDNKRVSERNLAAIHAFQREGGRFGLATGRTPMNVDYFSRLLSIDAPCILYNGAALYDLAQKRFLSLRCLPRAQAERIIRSAIELQNDVCIQIFTPNAIYEPNLSQHSDPQTVAEAEMLCLKTPLDQIEGEFVKFIFAQTPDRLKALCKALDLEKIAQGFTTFHSADVYMEFVAEGVGKGEMLDEARALLPDARVMLAIGDFENDLTLVKNADIGCAPANAIESVKRVANVVLESDNNHDALAAFLERVLPTIG